MNKPCCPRFSDIYGSQESKWSRTNVLALCPLLAHVHGGLTKKKDRQKNRDTEKGTEGREVSLVRVYTRHTLPPRLRCRSDD